MNYAVTRQRPYPDCHRVVAIAIGGRDSIGPDMYGRILYEGNDPREAARIAIAERKKWQAEPADEDEEPVAIGYESDMVSASECGSDEEIEAWGERVYEKLPKCAECGDLLGKERYHHEWSGDDEFCSDSCADVNWVRDRFTDGEP